MNSSHSYQLVGTARWFCASHPFSEGCHKGWMGCQMLHDCRHTHQNDNFERENCYAPVDLAVDNIFRQNHVVVKSSLEKKYCELEFFRNLAGNDDKPRLIMFDQLRFLTKIPAMVINYNMIKYSSTRTYHCSFFSFRFSIWHLLWGYWPLPAI